MKRVISDLEIFHNGVFAAVDVISSTYGYYGSGVLIDVEGNPLVTRDGAMVSNHLGVSDVQGILASRMVKDGSLATYADAGDGTTTCAVLIGAMVEWGLGRIAGGENAYDLVSRLGIAVDGVLDSLDIEAVDSLERMVEVATISANNNEEMGRLIGEMAWQLGVHGTAQFEEGMGEVTEIDVIDGGYFFEGGVFDKEMYRGRIEVSVPQVFLCSEKLDLTESLEAVFNAYFIEEKFKAGVLPSLVIVAPDVSMSVMANLRATVLGGRQYNPHYNILFIKAPSEAMMDDLAFLLGTKVFGQRYGRSLTKVGKNDFGVCKRFRVDQLGSVFFHNSAKDAIAAYVSANNIEGERMSRLMTGIGLIRVGGATGVERNNTRLMLDDCYKTCFAALRDGVIKGGGYGLYDASDKYSDFEEVFIAPLRKLLMNKFGDKTRVEDIMTNYYDNNEMLDLKSGETFVDHREVGLYDAVRATKSAIKNAYSVASQILTIRKLIIRE